LDRRAFLKSYLTLVLGTAIAGTGGGVYIKLLEPEWLDVQRVSIPLRYLPPELHGLRLIQLSDMHLEPCTELDFIKKALIRVSELEPDLIVLTGDFVYERADVVEEMAPLLSVLNPPLGVFACLGNHDYWTDAKVVWNGLERAGVQVLVNSNHCIKFGGVEFALAGLDDYWSGEPDLDKTLEGIPPRQAVVLMAHEPDPAENLLLGGRVGLQLSGHTHGGQVQLPLIGAPVLPYLGTLYPEGLYSVHQGFLYVNRGLGVVPPGVRFNCRPEITEITLESPELKDRVLG